MSSDYRLSHQGLAKASSYDAQFYTNPYRSMMWDLERRILSEVLSRHSNIRTALDFACGTGRIAKFLNDAGIEVVGVDVSEGMLSVAKARVPGARFVCRDITGDSDGINGPFDLITAFRFFPNAQTELREQVMAILPSLLSRNGIILFNNHKNKTSFTYRLAKAAFRRDFGVMGHEEVLRLVRANGLVITATYHLGVIPSNDRIRLLPIWVLKPLERILSKFKLARSFASNIVYVCEPNKANPAGRSVG